MIKSKVSVLFRKRIRSFLVPILLISLIFITYQLVMFLQFTKEISKKIVPNLIRGIHEQEQLFYKLDDNGLFKCITSMELIQHKQVNDDYCDCLDGSDEPGTNACPNGQFYCTAQIETKRFKKVVTSSKVNDGICDCCDGSDEWKGSKLLSLNDKVQKRLGHYQVPCPNLCPKS